MQAEVSGLAQDAGVRLGVLLDMVVEIRVPPLREPVRYQIAH